MPVTVTYQLNLIQNLDATQGPGAAEADIVGLANGGLAVSSTGGGDTDLDVFSPTFADSGGANGLTGTDSALDQLSNGNIVLVTETPAGVRYAIRNPTGGLVVASTPLGEAGANPDVAALTGAGGNFWIATEVVVTPATGDTAILIYSYFQDGTFDIRFAVDLTTAVDRAPSIAALDGGGFAVAWTREVGGQTEVWYAVFTAVGGQTKAPTLLDTTGTINRNVSVAAMNGGGFAIAYEDNGYDSDVDISLARFQADGDLIGQVTDLGLNPLLDEANPYVTRLSNGFLAVAMTTENQLSLAKDDTLVRLVDPATGFVVASRNVTGGETVNDDVGFAAVAGMSHGRIAAFHSNLTDGDIDGEALQGQRTSAGDGAGNLIVGDDFVDVMTGGAGNDILFARGNNDSLDGGEGNDNVNGGAGNDIIVGGAGIDLANFVEATGGVTVSLAILGPQNTGDGIDTISQCEDLHGTLFSDSLTGDGGANFLFGANTGNDFFDGGGGNDLLYGGAGNDTYIGGTGIDTVELGQIFLPPGPPPPPPEDPPPLTVDLLVVGPQNTGRGFDSFSGVENLRGSFGGDTFNGNALDNRFEGLGGNDTLRGHAAHDTLLGDVGNDLLYGDAGNDTLDGGAGLDRLYDGATNDVVFGGADADQLFAGPGIDRLDGGDGADRLYAHAASADTFVFASAVGIDRVFNFLTGIHNLEIDASVYGGVAGSFVFRANSNPVPPSATRALLYDTDDGKLWFDADGNGAGVRVHVLTLLGAPTLAATDILLV